MLDKMGLTGERRGQIRAEQFNTCHETAIFYYTITWGDAKAIEVLDINFYVLVLVKNIGVVFYVKFNLK